LKHIRDIGLDLAALNGKSGPSALKVPSSSHVSGISLSQVSPFEKSI